MSGRLMLNILQGHVKGRRRAGKPWREWMDIIRDWSNTVGVMELVSLKVI